MKEYFRKDYGFQNDIYSFLKEKYDEADNIFEKRFEISSDNVEQKSKTLENLIEEVNAKVNQEKQVESKVVSLVRGNIYLRLAQCQNEMFEKSREYYKKAIECLEKHIDYSNIGEIDLLLMLNKGKYFRNTADVGKKSDYERAHTIFCDITKSISKVDISCEKKLHLLLDAKINIGRVSRYSYDFKQAQEIFLSLIRTLEKGIDENIKDKIYNCDDLKELLQNAVTDSEVEEYMVNIQKEDSDKYVLEYLLQSLIHIGIIYRKNAKYDKAYTVFNLINEIDNSGERNIDASNNLGVCHRKRGEYYGSTSEDGQREYKDAGHIFEELKEKGNRFAIINWYKCILGFNFTDKNYEEIIKELEGRNGLGNSVGLQFLLGRFYAKNKQYDRAEVCFKNIYEQKPYIARGCIGFKAYYNLAQCKMHLYEISHARGILSEIREALIKNHNYIDILTEIDYGWCLMQEGKYHKALIVYNELLKFQKDFIRDKQILEINNNIAECYIHLESWQLAEEHLKTVLNVENKNIKALYLNGIILLNNRKNKECYNLFNNLIEKEANEIGINSGWLISAILLYFQEKNDETKENIIKKIRYSSNPISMKCFAHLADFVLFQLKEKNMINENNTLFTDFCHIKLINRGENMAFQFLMDSIAFHYFKQEDRSFILANLVKMYKYILKIKDMCRVTYKSDGITNKLPYHYTKLHTLNNLLIRHEEDAPKLRLWNSVYMNDAYEGKVFDKLLGQVDILKDIDIEHYIGNSKKTQSKIDSNVYITSFSTSEDSFQMWSIYGDNEKGVAIKFDENFFDIKDKFVDLILDDATNDEYPLYKVQYLDMNQIKTDDCGSILRNLEEIGEAIYSIEKRLEDLKAQNSLDEYQPFEGAKTEIRTFISDRLNEVRFLFKTKSYEYESELRLIRCSHKPNVDNINFDIPRLYINVEKKIEELEVKIGSKIGKQQIKDIFVWLKNTGKIKKIEVSSLNGNSV